MSIPTKEPSSITAGDSVSWNKTLGDYPANVYNLKYRLAPIAGGATTEISASANGTTHEIRLTPADTDTYNPGDYRLIPVVTDIANSGATVTKTLETTRLTVSPAADSELDLRTNAELTIAELRETYRKLARNTISSATVNGRTYNRNSMADLRAEIVYWENKVANEQGGARKYIAVQFNRPS